MRGGWRAVEGGVELRVKAQPKARRAGLQGWIAAPDGPRLKLAVHEAPEDGRANKAICALLAGALHVPPSAITVVQGATSREKTCRILGDSARLHETLEGLA
ncbi:DUF167 domain-containing protein [Pseudoroseomonas cervicalis]|uniref:UPF0235 protein HMPREF0731_1908 n=1 Tax=Pseudoroseomonas cervicalis ATCC 49957 TaxID=525371 RepID=D5RLE7_9PROT|nr:DUF167 domain-containing protein [Pseudoroseomonas cervicalis]EFH11872.1 hypothetical protein HMPREF0731_1908 [Pseudoroseomonas cervicalis ATCC 49957]MDQ1081176.1 uncharacterized protein YggU (UPF0235/DUF167 family) [Pseudoroseomonas cervicalis]WBV42992.1 DUF167 domain-containing protein [Pseudoroseomonas cervicalis]